MNPTRWPTWWGRVDPVTCDSLREDHLPCLLEPIDRDFVEQDSAAGASPCLIPAIPPDLVRTGRQPPIQSANEAPTGVEDPDAGKCALAAPLVDARTLIKNAWSLYSL